MSTCIVCDKKFKEDDLLQAFLSCPEDPNGSWTKPVLVDAAFQERFASNKCKIRRKHKDCDSEPLGISNKFY